VRVSAGGSSEAGEGRGRSGGKGGETPYRRRANTPRAGGKSSAFDCSMVTYKKTLLKSIIRAGCREGPRNQKRQGRGQYTDGWTGGERPVRAQGSRRFSNQCLCRSWHGSMTRRQLEGAEVHSSAQQNGLPGLGVKLEKGASSR